jgi:UDP-glucose:(heptosyl)LPS alpha-1,3-glucosyltransferase
VSGPAIAGPHGGGARAPEPASGAGAGEPGVACEVTIVANDIGSVGGMERQLGELIGGLTRLGHRVRVIAWTCRLPEDVPVEFHRVRGPRRPFLLGYPCFLVSASLALRKQRRPGVVQSTGAIVGVPVDFVAIHCCHQVYRETPRRMNLAFRAYVAVMGLVKRAGERWCVRVNRDARFVCVSEGVAQEMREHYPAAAGRVLTIHNGVDTEAFAPGRHAEQALALRRSLAIGDERLLAAFVARGWGHKGLGPAIEALAQTPEWDLLVAGDGDARHYRALAGSLGVADRVHWLGIRRDIEVVYELADAFVLPSSYETFSLVCFEAAASGVPVLATPVSGVTELVTDGESGFLIERDASSIADRLRRLGEDSTLRQQMGRSAREAALRFGWQDMVARHHELYQSVASTADATCEDSQSRGAA